MAITVRDLISAQSRVLERIVILLERAKHGTLARAAKARAENLAVVAEGVEGKLKCVFPCRLQSWLAARANNKLML